MREFPKLLILIPVFWAAACVSRPPAPTTNGLVTRVPKLNASEGALVFPYGRYRHQVHIQVAGQGKDQTREFSFNAVVVTSPSTVDLVALSPFNTTLMKVHEDRQTGEVRGEAFEERIRQHLDELGRFYPVLRSLLLMPRSGAGGDDHLQVVERSVDGEPRVLSYRGRLNVELMDFQDHMPRRLRMTQAHFQAQVQVEPL